ncbi:MAG: type III-A CRISPR-associated protein Csm2 [Campylobacterales bacterium]
MHIKTFTPDFKTNSKLATLFSDDAEKIAKEIEKNQLISTTQYRKFYDWVMKWEEKGEGLPKERFDREILPMVKFLKSKVQYAATRRHCKREFKDFIARCVDKVGTQEELQNFKLFLEAILGFLPRK